MSAEKIGKIEAICLMLIIVVNELIINVPNMIILDTKTGSTLNIFYVSILAVIFTYIICRLFKPFYGKDILDVSEYVGGEILKTILGILFLLFFIFLSSINLRYFANSLKVIYFNTSPLVYILLFFLIPALHVNKYGLRAISGVNLIFLPIILASFIFLMISSYDNFTMVRIFPILGEGFNETFIRGATNIFAFTGLSFIYFLPALLKNSKDFKKVSVISVIISAVCLILSILSLIMAFPAITKTDETLSVYLLTRLVELGDFLERLDALFIFIWIIAHISFLSLTFFYILKIFQKITKIEDSRTLTSTLGLIVLSSSLIYKDIAELKFIARFFLKYSTLILIFVICFGVLILGNIKYKRKNKNNS